MKKTMSIPTVSFGNRHGFSYGCSHAVKALLVDTASPARLLVRIGYHS